ncbi:MAG: hypothetical protein J6X49_18070 [Victivallales bacterium]|nr:hypothetical protein [Victivallales bacterium]
MVFAKDTEHAYLYSLGEFSAAEDGIRETTDLIEKYKRGLLGALPKPDLFNVAKRNRTECGTILTAPKRP